MNYLRNIIKGRDKIIKLKREKKDVEYKLGVVIKKLRNERKQKRYLKDEFLTYRSRAKCVMDYGENIKLVFERFARMVGAANGMIEADYDNIMRLWKKMEKQIDKINFDEKRFGTDISIITDKESVQ